MSLNTKDLKKEWRKTEQHLLPELKPFLAEGNYDIYPSYKLEDNLISVGYQSLSREISKHTIVIIDGYIGVFYDQFREKLDKYLRISGKRISWINTSAFLKSSDLIKEMISPFTGGDDPVFGKRTSLGLEDFFNINLLKETKPDPDADLNIIIGPGSTLADWKGLLVYIDIPKNEIQFRSRAGSITNLGASYPSDPKEMYKRFYFIDWIVLNRHKRDVFNKVDMFVDAQRPGYPCMMDGELLRHSLSVMSRNVFRVRPWFEPGTWGGGWIVNHIKGLNKDVPN